MEGNNLLSDCGAFLLEVGFIKDERPCKGKSDKWDLIGSNGPLRPIYHLMLMELQEDEVCAPCFNHKKGEVMVMASYCYNEDEDNYIDCIYGLVIESVSELKWILRSDMRFRILWSFCRVPGVDCSKFI